MRAARSPDRTQTTAGATSHRRPDRAYSTPSWCEPDGRPTLQARRFLIHDERTDCLTRAPSGMAIRDEASVEPAGDRVSRARAGSRSRSRRRRRRRRRSVAQNNTSSRTEQRPKRAPSQRSVLTIRAAPCAAEFPPTGHTRFQVVQGGAAAILLVKRAIEYRYKSRISCDADGPGVRCSVRLVDGHGRSRTGNLCAHLHESLVTSTPRVAARESP